MLSLTPQHGMPSQSDDTRVVSLTCSVGASSCLLVTEILGTGVQYLDQVVLMTHGSDTEPRRIDS
jgi:hypothetical protein